MVSLGPVVPIDEFSTTHSIGASIEYSLYFGKLFLSPEKPVAFIANAGLSYYPGKKENTGLPANYKYPRYTFFHFFGGINYSPLKKIALNIFTGPGIGLYNDNTMFNMGAIICCNYYISGKTAITPGLFVMKETRSDAIWSLSVKASIVF